MRNEFPAPVVYGGETYPSVLHGYWALSAVTPADHDQIRDAESSRETHELGGRAERKADWPLRRLAVMRGLLEAKFTRHRALAQILLAAGDSRISYTSLWDSPFSRDVPGYRTRNWMGRLLGLTRSELVIQRALSPTDILNQ